MKRKLVFMVLFVAALGALVVFLFTQKASGTVVFSAGPGMAPYEITLLSGENYECPDRECSFDLEVGDYTFYIEKEGYYTIEESVRPDKGERVEIELDFEEVTGAFEESGGELDESVFDNCYGSAEECGLADVYFLEEDADTGYMVLREGDERRATFLQGMKDTAVFASGDKAVVYDRDSGNAYLVDFIDDSRSFLFNMDSVDALMFGENFYALESGGVIYWVDGRGVNDLRIEGGLAKAAELDGRLYFLAEDDGGVYLGAFDGYEYYTVLEALDFGFENTVLASDGGGVYARDGDKVWELVF